MDMQQFLVTDIGCCASDPLEPGVRAQAIETQQTTLSQGCFRQGNPRGRRFESIHQYRAQSSLFQPVQQSGHRPALTNLDFYRRETLRFGPGFEQCTRYPVVAAPPAPNLAGLW